MRRLKYAVCIGHVKQKQTLISLVGRKISVVGVYKQQNKITKIKNNKIFERKNIFH
jgi:hypothetical protein